MLTAATVRKRGQRLLAEHIEDHEKFNTADGIAFVTLHKESEDQEATITSLRRTINLLHGIIRTRDKTITELKGDIDLARCPPRGRVSVKLEQEIYSLKEEKARLQKIINDMLAGITTANSALHNEVASLRKREEAKDRIINGLLKEIEDMKNIDSLPREILNARLTKEINYLREKMTEIHKACYFAPLRKDQ